MARQPTPGHVVTTPILLAVLAGALMHASWNALVKVGLDRLISLSLIQVACALISYAVFCLKKLAVWRELGTGTVPRWEWFLIFV